MQLMLQSLCAVNTMFTSTPEMSLYMMDTIWMVHYPILLSAARGPPSTQTGVCALTAASAIIVSHTTALPTAPAYHKHAVNINIFLIQSLWVDIME